MDLINQSDWNMESMIEEEPVMMARQPIRSSWTVSLVTNIE